MSVLSVAIQFISGIFSIFLVNSHCILRNKDKLSFFIVSLQQFVTFFYVYPSTFCEFCKLLLYYLRVIYCMHTHLLLASNLLQKNLLTGKWERWSHLSWCKGVRRSGAAEAIILGFVIFSPLLIVGFKVNVSRTFQFCLHSNTIWQKLDQNSCFYESSR